MTAQDVTICTYSKHPARAGLPKVCCGHYSNNTDRLWRSASPRDHTKVSAVRNQADLATSMYENELTLHDGLRHIEIYSYPHTSGEG
jgi:hypothetical protein